MTFHKPCETSFEVKNGRNVSKNLDYSEIFLKNRRKSLVESKLFCSFGADKHNSITNKLIVAKKNERNDEEISPMSSGSMTK